jgi:hypothetical protein
MPSLFPLCQSNLGASGLFMLDFMHTAIAVLYERVIRLAPVAFRQQAFECPSVVPRKGGEPFMHMTAATAASYSNSMMKIVHDRCVSLSQLSPSPLFSHCLCVAGTFCVVSCVMCVQCAGPFWAPFQRKKQAHEICGPGEDGVRCYFPTAAMGVRVCLRLVCVW